jgi:hypothetical protein
MLIGSRRLIADLRRVLPRKRVRTDSFAKCRRKRLRRVRGRSPAFDGAASPGAAEASGRIADAETLRPPFCGTGNNFPAEPAPFGTAGMAEGRLRRSSADAGAHFPMSFSAVVIAADQRFCRAAAWFRKCRNRRQTGRIRAGKFSGVPIG